MAPTNEARTFTYKCHLGLYNEIIERLINLFSAYIYLYWRFVVFGYGRGVANDRGDWQTHAEKEKERALSSSCCSWDWLIMRCRSKRCNVMARRVCLDRMLTDTHDCKETVTDDWTPIFSRSLFDPVERRFGLIASSGEWVDVITGESRLNLRFKIFCYGHRCNYVSEFVLGISQQFGLGCFDVRHFANRFEDYRLLEN